MGSLGWEDPLKGGMQLTSVDLPGECHEQRNLVATVHGVAESDMTEQLGTAQSSTIYQSHPTRHALCEAFHVHYLA